MAVHLVSKWGGDTFSSFFMSAGLWLAYQELYILVTWSVPPGIAVDLCEGLEKEAFRLDVGNVL